LLLINEIVIKKGTMQMQREHDVLLRAIRDKDNQVKNLRRLDMTVNNVRLSAPMIKKRAEDHDATLELFKREDKLQKKKMQELRKDIDIGLYEYLQLEGLEKAEVEKMTAQAELNRRMEKELEDTMLKRIELARQIDTLNGERDLKVLQNSKA
jgi:hypothetical protein